MERISTASSDTSKINKTIDKIAFHTNLLALIAAAETAKSPEVLIENILETSALQIV